jgi:hypothetical protein
VICVVSVVSHVGWLMSASVADQRAWGTVHFGEAFAADGPLDMSCCKTASMHWLDMRLQQVWAKVGFWE